MKTPKMKPGERVINKKEIIYLDTESSSEIGTVPAGTEGVILDKKVGNGFRAVQFDGHVNSLNVDLDNIGPPSLLDRITRKIFE